MHKFKKMEDLIIQDKKAKTSQSVEAVKREIKRFEKAKQLTEEFKNIKDYRSSIANFRICLESFLNIAVGVGGLKYEITYEDIFSSKCFFCDEHYLQKTKNSKKKQLKRELEDQLFVVPGESENTEKSVKPDRNRLLVQYRSLRPYLRIESESDLIDKAYYETSNDTHHDIIDYSFKRYYDFRNKYIKMVYQDFDMLFQYLKDHFPMQMMQDDELVIDLRNCVESTQKEINVIYESVEEIKKSYKRFQKGNLKLKNNEVLKTTAQELSKVYEACCMEVEQCKTRIDKKTSSYKEFTIDVIGPFASGKSTLIKQICHVFSKELNFEFDNQGQNMEYSFENLKFREIEPVMNDEQFFSGEDGFADFIICVFNGDYLNREDNQKICNYLKGLNKPYQCVFNEKSRPKEEYDECKNMLKSDLDCNLGYTKEILLFNFRTLEDHLDREAFCKLVDIIKRIIKTKALSLRRLCLYEFVEETVYGQFVEQNRQLNAISQKKDELLAIFDEYKVGIEKLQEKHINEIGDYNLNRSITTRISNAIKSIFKSSDEDDLMKLFQDDYEQLSKQFNDAFDGKLEEIKLVSQVQSKELSLGVGLCATFGSAAVIGIMRNAAPFGMLMGFGFSLAHNFLKKSIKGRYDGLIKKVNSEFDKKKTDFESAMKTIVDSFRELPSVCLKSHKIMVKSLLNNYFEELGYEENELQKIINDVARVPGKYILIRTCDKKFFFPELMSELKLSFGSEQILLLGNDENPNGNIPQEIAEQLNIKEKEENLPESL